MSVLEHSGDNRYIGDDATVAFPYGFKILDDDEIEFLVNGITQVKGSNYSVSGVGATNGGTVTAVLPPTTVAVSLLRAQPISQLINFVANESYNPLKVMRAFDRATMVDQMLAERLDRAPLLAPKSTYQNLLLDDPVASQVLRWKADLSGVESVPLSSVLAGISGITATLVAGRIVYASSASNLDTSANLLWDASLNRITVSGGAGVWTNTQYNGPAKIILNSMDAAAAYAEEQGGNQATDGLTVAVKVPNGSTVYGASAIAAFIDAEDASTIPVAAYFQARAKVNGANIFSLNTLMADEGFTGVQMQNELDFNVAQAGTIVHGLTLKGESSVEPTVSAAIIIDEIGITGNFAWQEGIVFAAGSFTSVGIQFQAGATKGGDEPSIQLGALATGNSKNSQFIQFIGTDAGGVPRIGQIQVAMDGAMLLRSGKDGQAIVLQDFNAGVGTNLVIADTTKVTLAANAGDIQWGKPLVAVGGGAAPTFGTIGGSGPATASQNGWMRVLDSTGVAFWVPAWK